MAASVATKASMVAILGAIMPEPLAMPAMRTGVPSMKASATAPLGKVSVVAMAEAAKRQASGRRLSAVSGTSSVMRASSSTTPMTPVLASITSRLPTPSRLATLAATRSAARAPALPVKELAQPALTTRARTSRPRLERSWALHQSTGAEPTPWRVKTPAQVVPGAKRMINTSSRSPG